MAIYSRYKAGALETELNQILSAEGSPSADFDDARLQFCASVLKDVLRAGGRLVRDSRLLVSWPDWEGPDGRRNAQIAVAAAREMRPLKDDELSRVQPMFRA